MVFPRAGFVLSFVFLTAHENGAVTMDVPCGWRRPNWRRTKGWETDLGVPLIRAL